MTAYLDDIWSQPEELEAAFDTTVVALASTLTAERCADLQEIVLCGCGDSHHAGVGSALAFERFTGLRTRALTSMQMSRYESALSLQDSLVIAVSVSGQTTRTVEAAMLAREAGALTVGVSANPESKLASRAELFVGSAVPPAELHGPDARTYMSSLLVLLLASIQVGESRGHLSTDAAQQARERLRGCSALMRVTLESADPVAERVAASLVAEGFSAIMAVGSGPAFGVALFAAAKIVEAGGTNAWAQDGEEWAHLEYWLTDVRIPTIVIAAMGRSEDRMHEQVATMNRIGRRAVVIAPHSSPLLAQTDHGIGVAEIEEAFAPLVYAVVVELLSFYLVKAAQLPIYAVTRDDHSDGPSNAIRSTVAAEQLEALRASAGGRRSVR